METFFAPCPRGLSHLLADELRALDASDVLVQEAGVQFRGPLTLAYRANLHSRLASRFLWQVAHFAYDTEQDIYDAAFLIAWPSWFAVEHTIKVDINAHRCPLKSLDFITLRVKDAICDKFREQLGSRPSVDAREPDIRIHVFLDATHATLYLDTTGEPLFKRGLREHHGEAPLKKNLAAGILMLTGWQPGIPLLDPMCGSGTFLIEAAEISLKRAPGLKHNFAFTKLKNFQPAVWQALLDAAHAAILPATELPIYGSDLYGDALTDAARNLEANDLGASVALKQANILEISAPAPTGIMVTNPPYGVRLGETSQLAELYPKLGDMLKQKFTGWNAYLFSGDTQLPKLIRLTTSKKTPLFNGKLECRLYEYKVVAGGNRKT